MGAALQDPLRDPLRDPGEPELAEQLFEALGALRRQLRRLAGRPWPAVPLSGAQVEVVRLVRREPGMPVSRAAEVLGLAANTVSTLVGQLCEAGLLRRSPSAADRRVVQLEVTPAARRRIEGWRDERAELVAAGLDRLDGADRRAIAGALPALSRLAAALAEHETPGADR